MKQAVKKSGRLIFNYREPQRFFNSPAVVECIPRGETDMSVKLLLRDEEFEVRAGMTLLSSMEKAGILPESVIAMRDHEMILEDEILQDGEVITLISVISGG
jgi:sulfur carrier protein ThiS